MKKHGFSGQWVDIFTAGTHVDDTGRTHEIDARFLEQVVTNFNPEQHEPPAVVGHPKTDAPAFGWVCASRVEGDRLQVQFCDVDPRFEELVREGKFKKRSASFYLDAGLAPGGRAPQLRHVGFLGAQPPAVKGLREIHFNEGDGVTFETTNFSEGDGMGDKEEEKKTVREQIADFFRETFGGTKESAPANFSEGDLKKMIGDAVATVEAKLSETTTRLENENKELRTRLDSHSGSATRTEIVSFCERLGAGKFLPAFRRMGVIEFMEALAAVPEKKVSIVTFAEEGGQEVEKKVEITPLQFFQNFLATLPPFVEFGEKFGDLKVRGNGSELIDPQEIEKLRTGMEMKPEGGAK